jgi:lysozyme family protein
MPDFSSICAWSLRFEDSTLSGKVTVDDGGTTRFGVSSNAHPEVGGPNSYFYACDTTSALNLAAAYYKSWFWNSWFDQLTDDALAAAIFDFSVNSGQSKAVKTLQALLNLTQDGVFGYYSMTACNQNPVGIAAKLRTARAAWCTEVAAMYPSDTQYLPNWLKRAACIYPDNGGL